MRKRNRSLSEAERAMHSEMLAKIDSENGSAILTGGQRLGDRICQTSQNSARGKNAFGDHLKICSASLADGSASAVVGRKPPRNRADQPDIARPKFN